MAQSTFSDEELTAYLDAEAEPDLAGRIEDALAQDGAVQAQMAELSAPLEAIKSAFDLDALEAPTISAHLLQVEPERRGMPRFAMPLGMAASFVLGMAIMWANPPKQDWVAAIASYQALYVTETLSGVAQEPEVSEQVLARFEAAVGVDLTTTTEVEGLEFRRAQMLAVDNEPLIQLAFLDASGIPFAFCVTGRSDQDVAPSTITSHGVATTSWVQDGIGYVLLGGADEARIKALSEQFQAVL